LHAGRLDTEKQVEVVIRAAAKSMESSPAHLLMIGDGTCREDLEYLCRDLGIAERAHFTGFIHDSRLLSWYYRLANVFVITSQIETQGLAALEAAACGLPIIAANAGALPELVRHEVNGFLAPPGEVEATSQWLTKLLRDPALARQMGTNSWNIAQEHAFEHTVEAYEACFRKAINQAKEQQSVTRSTVFDL
jgi:glycosyltransferase involved in cell wall biosynthesis